MKNSGINRIVADKVEIIKQNEAIGITYGLPW